MKANKLFFLFIGIFLFLIIFCNNCFASTLGLANYDVSTLTIDELKYLKKCSDSVVKYCNENSISFEEYPYYFILYETENFSFSNTGYPFYIFISDSNTTFAYWGSNGYGFGKGDRYTFEFNTGSTEFTNTPSLTSFSDWRYSVKSPYLKVFYNNFPDDGYGSLTPNNEIDFYNISDETPTNPDEPEIPVEPDVPDEPETPDEPDVPNDSGSTKKLANIYQGMSFNNVLEEILKLLPILLLILISYIGIRKGISFLIDFFRKS